MNTSETLQALVASGLIDEGGLGPGEEYKFRHTLLQDAAYASLLKAARTELHRAVGEAMEACFPDRAEALAPELGLHFDEGGDGRKAVRYFKLAGDSAARVYAETEAIQYYARALELASRQESPGEELRYLYEKLGRQYELVADYDRALANYRDMEARARDLQAPAFELAARLLRTNLYCRPSAVHDPEKGEALAEEALVMANELGDRVSAAQALWNLMLVKTFSSQFRQSSQFGERALELARAENLSDLIPFILNDLATVYVVLGERKKGDAAQEEARRLWEASGNLPMLVDNMGYLVVNSLLQGRYDEAIARSEEMLARAKEIDNPWGQAYSRYLIYLAFADRGEFGRAIEIAAECIRLAEAAGFIVPLVETRAELGWFYVYLGQPERGLRLAEEGIHTAEQSRLGWVGIPQAIKAVMLLRVGRISEAQELIESMRVKPIEEMAREIWGDSLYYLIARAELSLVLDDPEMTIASVNVFLEGMNRAGFRILVADGLVLKASAHLRLGQAEQARQVLEQARALSEELQSRRVLWHILEALSRLEAERGRQAEAGALRQQARATIEYLAAHTGSEDLRASFLARPDVRAVLDGA